LYPLANNIIVAGYANINAIGGQGSVKKACIIPKQNIRNLAVVDFAHKIVGKIKIQNKKSKIC